MAREPFYTLPPGFSQTTSRVLVIVSYGGDIEKIQKSLDPRRFLFRTKGGKLKKISPRQIDVLATPEMHTGWTQLVISKEGVIPKNDISFESEDPFGLFSINAVIESCLDELNTKVARMLPRRDSSVDGETIEVISTPEIKLYEQVKNVLILINNMVCDGKLSEQDAATYSWFSSVKSLSDSALTWKSIYHLLASSPKKTVQVLWEIFAELANEQSGLYEIINTEIESFLSVPIVKAGVKRNPGDLLQRQACLFHLVLETFFLKMAIDDGYKLIYTGKRIEVMQKITDFFVGKDDAIWASSSEIISADDHRIYCDLSAMMKTQSLMSLKMLWSAHSEEYALYTSRLEDGSELLTNLLKVRNFFEKLFQLKNQLQIEASSSSESSRTTSPTGGDMLVLDDPHGIKPVDNEVNSVESDDVQRVPTPTTPATSEMSELFFTSCCCGDHHARYSGWLIMAVKDFVAAHHESLTLHHRQVAGGVNSLLYSRPRSRALSCPTVPEQRTSSSLGYGNK